MLVVGGGLCPGTSINDRQADRTPGQPLTKSCSPCPQPQEEAELALGGGRILPARHLGGGPDPPKT